MTDVFLLWHSRPISGGDTDDKLIGVYGSYAAAKAAIDRKLTFAGFREHPDCFHIASYELDRDAWSEGFGVE
ncbi:MAG: hypothetical protein J0I47_03610 [Sphingomonas sp.]|uniref:hypothetical protein n=1 Tax=Sphingomonas sp. TaxID=28214 RepID=UPI001AC4BCAB|nr:hypothetical protein [Sphingomonas sp.]MBN8807312.1 hypothetical protein [Sphingomonas sp.]